YLYAAARAGGAPRVSRRFRARLDGARRAADPRPVEGSGPGRRVGGHARHDPAQAVPALVRSREGGAHQYASRREQRVDGRGGGEALRADFPVAARPERIVYWRRENP